MFLEILIRIRHDVIWIKLTWKWKTCLYQSDSNKRSLKFESQCFLTRITRLVIQIKVIQSSSKLTMIQITHCLIWITHLGMIQMTCDKKFHLITFDSLYSFFDSNKNNSWFDSNLTVHFSYFGSYLWHLFKPFLFLPLKKDTTTCNAKLWIIIEVTYWWSQLRETTLINHWMLRF